MVYYRYIIITYSSKYRHHSISSQNNFLRASKNKRTLSSRTVIPFSHLMKIKQIFWCHKILSFIFTFPQWHRKKIYVLLHRIVMSLNLFYSFTLGTVSHFFFFLIPHTCLRWDRGFGRTPLHPLDACDCLSWSPHMPLHPLSPVEIESVSRGMIHLKLIIPGKHSKEWCPALQVALE